MTPRAHEIVGPFPPGQRPEDYDQLRRRVMWSMPTGLYLLGSRSGDARNFMTASWVVQLAREPKLVGVSVERDALTHHLVETGRTFTLSLLARSERDLVRRFAKPAELDAAARTLGGIAFRDAAVGGAPIPLVASAYLDCALEREIDFGSHSLFVGEVVDASFGDGVDASTEWLRMEDTRMNYGG